MKTLVSIVLILSICALAHTQDFEQQIQTVQDQIENLNQERKTLELAVEDIKFERMRQQLKSIGLPSTTFIEHNALILEYNEQHEQAKWVAHIITADIMSSTLARTNDFRPDPLIPTGTAIQTDYFLTDTLANGKVEYDGFGYDRGHLAPSADFRWSARAMSDSYYYSNMSPQRPEFNREGWAALESQLRGHIYNNPETQLYIITGPVLTDDLPVIERSVNKVSIPEQYFKVVLDINARQGIGFLMPNASISYPLEHYAVTIDEIEQATGLDFFSKLVQEEELESSLEKAHWFEGVALGDVESLYPPSLPRNHFNTIQARDHIGSGKNVIICGKVVSARYSRAGHAWLNLDKRYPNDICSVMIRKENLVNFEGDPLKLFEGQVVAVKGKVFELGGKPVVGVERGEHLSLLEKN